MGMPLIDLSDQDATVLADLLREAISRDRVFPLPAHVIARARATLEQLETALRKTKPSPR
jgi:hypothetical protein